MAFPCLIFAFQAQRQSIHVLIIQDTDNSSIVRTKSQELLEVSRQEPLDTIQISPVSINGSIPLLIDYIVVIVLCCHVQLWREINHHSLRLDSRCDFPHLSNFTVTMP